MECSPPELVSSIFEKPARLVIVDGLGSVCMFVSLLLCGGLKERNELSGDINIFLTLVLNFN